MVYSCPIKEKLHFTKEILMKKFFVMALLVALVPGCASIISGSKQNISVNSNVAGADVILHDLEKKTDEKLGVTPFTGLAPRVKSAKLIVKKDGYKPVEVLMATEVEGVFWANIFCGGTTGSSTDFSTGAMWKYSPNSYMANLEPGSKGAQLEQFKKESPVRVFAVMNYDRLSSNISTGKGEYLDSLYVLVGAKTQNDKAKAFVKIQNAQSKAVSIPDFADRLVSIL
jgi:uncharacterized protein YceK